MSLIQFFLGEYNYKLYPQHVHLLVVSYTRNICVLMVYCVLNIMHLDYFKKGTVLWLESDCFFC